MTARLKTAAWQMVNSYGGTANAMLEALQELGRAAEAEPDDPQPTERDRWAQEAERGIVLVPTSRYERRPESPGMLYYVGQRTIMQVMKDLRDALGADPAGGEEYFTIRAGCDLDFWPEGDIKVYHCRGGSEGDYVHVDVGQHSILLAKTFQGRAAARSFAAAVADLLGV